jgi:hypothetical protein
MNEKKITTIFKKASRIKPRKTWLNQSKAWLMDEIQKQEQSFNIFIFISNIFLKHRVIFLSLFILLFLGATTVLAVFYINNLGPRSDTIIGTTAKWLADEWRNMERLLK